MGEMASLWGYAEHQDMDQLGQKLLFTTLELEKLKSETMEEMRKNKEYANQLIHLLKSAIQQRDEARNQLGKLINKTMSLTNSQSLPTFAHFQGDSPLLKPVKANSSITESNSLSETYNYHSHGSPPVESLFDTVTSPALSNMIATQPLVQESNASFSNNNFNPNIGQGSLIIDNLVKGRVLPQKGMFLQAVLEAGPLLQTLLVAGPMPRWRNPPLLQAFQIPPVSIKGGDAEVLAQKPASNVGQLGGRQMSSHSYANFGNLVSGNCLRIGSLIPSAVGNNGCFRLAKRQRFC